MKSLGFSDEAGTGRFWDEKVPKKQPIRKKFDSSMNQISRIESFHLKPRRKQKQHTETNLIAILQLQPCGLRGRIWVRRMR